MKMIYKMTVLSLTILALSCYKDLGNYNYKEINEIEISGLPEEKIYANRNVDFLRVKPKIESTLDKNHSEYEYTWNAYLMDGMVDGEIVFNIGDELELDYFIILPDAEYDIYLEVKDPETEVTWRNSFPLKVTTNLNEGWLILSDENGYSRLDVISLSGKDEFIVRDVWNDSPFKNKKGPKHLPFLADLYGNHSIYHISNDGTTKLDGEDFSYDPVNDFLYELAKFEDNFQVLELRSSYIAATYICVAKQGVYTKNNMGWGAIYGMPVNRIEEEGEYFEVAPAIGLPVNPYAYNPAVVFYDVTNERFVQLLSNSRGMRLPSAEENVFSFQTGKKFVYMENTFHDQGITFTILKDNSGTHWLYGLKVQGYNFIEQLTNYYYPLNIPDIEKATAFAIHPILYYLFYAVGDKIHQYDMVNKVHRVLSIEYGDEEVRNSLNGETISLLKFNVFGLGTYSKPEGSEDMQYRLIVGSHSSENGLTGIVRMIEIPPSMEKNAIIYSEYNGFGIVRDVTYRERN